MLCIPAGKPLHYKGVRLHRIVNGFLAQGGDVVKVRRAPRCQRCGMGSSGWCSTGSSGRHLQSPPQGCKKKTTRHLLCHALQGDGSAGDSIYGGKFKDEPAALKLKWAPAAWLRRACPSQGICCIAPAAHDPPSPLCMKSHPALHLPAHAERPSAPTCMQARWAWSGGLCQLGCVLGLRPIAEQARALHGAVNRAPPLQ